VFPSPKWLLDRVTILRYTHPANRLRSLDVACHFPHRSIIVPQIYTVFSLSFLFHGKSQTLPALAGVILHNVSFHRCYWFLKTVSSYFKAPEILQLARAVLIGDSVASFILWKQIFCDSNYKMAPSAPFPTEQSVIIPPFNTKYS